MSRKILTGILAGAIYLGTALSASAQVKTAVADTSGQAPSAAEASAQAAASQAPAESTATGDSRTPTQALTPNKRRENIHRYLYAIYTKQENLDSQEQELKELISLVPENNIFHYEYGLLMMKQGKYNDAIQHFDDSEKVDPNYGSAYAKEGECYSKMKKYKQAIEQYTIAQQHAKSGQSFKSQIDVNQQLLERYEQEQKYLQQINKRGK
jgi:tetratricopeptide (TPR) repeat protein